MEKKFQVFISSTHDDLEDARNVVTKAILELGDIPVGMEMFSAGDEDQWRLIARQISQSDYYIVLLAHRYGSMTGDISYTEKEYDYAVEIGVPVLGFVLDAEAQWPTNLIDSDPLDRARLANFKAKIKSRMVSFWSTSDGLSSKVVVAISKQKNLNPRPGWIRAINIPGPEVMNDVADLSKEVARLSEENARLRETAGVEARFSLIDAMADNPMCQAVIFMYESGQDLPKHSRYVYGYVGGGGGSGTLGGYGRETLEGAGITRPAGGGRVNMLTEEGTEFAQWLIKKGRKCHYFWTNLGGWGKVPPGEAQEKWLLDAGIKPDVAES